MKPLIQQATQHNCSGQDVPVYVIDIGVRRVVVTKQDVQKR